MKSEEIAKLAGVSRSTVSRVINHYPNVPEETRKRVLEVIEAYNYHPNTFARTLAGKKSNTIGLFFMITEDKSVKHRIFHNDFFAYYLDSLVDLANMEGYYVLVQTVSGDSDYEKIKQAIFEKRMDGAIVLGTREDTLLRMQAERLSIPMILFDYEAAKVAQQFKQASNIVCINSDDGVGVEHTVAKLAAWGHTQIGFIRGNEETLSARKRYQAFIASMAKHGLGIEPRDVLRGDFLYGTAYQSMLDRIGQGALPTAFICANDNMALAAMAAIKESGLSVPEDVSIIGFDNIPSSTYSNPPLSTLGPDFYLMAREAISLLHTMITEQSKVPDEVHFDVELLLRESCGKRQ